MISMENNEEFVNLYNTKARVFKLIHETKPPSWKEKVEHFIPVSLVATIVENNNNDGDSFQSKRELKIIGTDDESGEMVLDEKISLKTVFTARSEKFVQWIDNSNELRGLGFNSKFELQEFVETFQQLQQDILEPQISNHQKHQQQLHQPQQQLHHQPQPQQQLNQSQQQHHQQQQQQQQQPINNVVETNGTKLYQPNNNKVNSSSTLPHQRAHTHHQYRLSSTDGASPDGNAGLVGQSEWQIREQLKYENERLKQALEESSKNAGIWHNELLTLRTNNVKLTQALHESKANVKEWERELERLRFENEELKLRVSAFESATDDSENKIDYIREMKSELRKKQSKVEELQKSMEELELKQQSQATSFQTINGQQLPHKLDVINAKLEVKVNELMNVQKEFEQLLNKLH